MVKKCVLDIVFGYLIKNEYDGLYNSNYECACEWSDLAPCSEMQHDCFPGHKTPCDCGDGHDWHIEDRK
ncbi:MAG: hypothetical protein ACW99G_23015 [Candidatus Thorarchaeota archaeon]|jgi:hypothetical protein